MTNTRLAPGFVAFSSEERALALADAALRSQVSAVILEKDFWVSWLLGLMFAAEELAPHLLFKGGTSLSKVYAAIDRFSEDVDLSLAPAFVGMDEETVESLGSRTRRDAAMLEMQRLCGTATQKILQPLLEASLRDELGMPQGESAWLRYEFDDATHAPVLHFRYPAALRGGPAYIRNEVKLEFGTLTDQQPTGRHPVRPLVADAFPDLFQDWHCEVTALALERTFWEKATILHAEHHRPAGQPMPDRYARHYSDMARLLGHPQGAAMLADHEQCARVVDWKGRFFARQWARYDLARPGTFRLAPTKQRRDALARDYAAMRPMFLSEPTGFADLITQLADAERTLNSDA